MTDLNKLTGQIEVWGHNKGIIPNSTPEAQFKKTMEEVLEIHEALVLGDKAKLQDAYGDVFVTLVMGASCAELDIKQCVEAAYNEISGRKGKMVNGIFVKDD